MKKKPTGGEALKPSSGARIRHVLSDFRLELRVSGRCTFPQIFMPTGLFWPSFIGPLAHTGLGSVPLASPVALLLLSVFPLPEKVRTFSRHFLCFSLRRTALFDIRAP